MSHSIGPSNLSNVLCSAAMYLSSSSGTCMYNPHLLSSVDISPVHSLLVWAILYLKLFEGLLNDDLDVLGISRILLVLGLKCRRLVVRFIDYEGHSLFLLMSHQCVMYDWYSAVPSL